MRWKLWSIIKPSYLYIKYIMLEPSIITFYLNSGVIISFLKIYSIFLVNVDNTHRGAVLIIREKYFPYFPIIISIKKTYTLNWLAMFYQIFFPPWPNNSPLMVDGIKKCLCCYHTFIDSIWCGYLNPSQNNTLYFLFSVASEFLQFWGTRACELTFLPRMGQQAVQVVCYTQIWYYHLHGILVIL